ncbi:hypothetical protein ElyMa_006583400 [Elysia marginata]|uniref:Uncharacterized protein n=1 Tax=Elysia marginata TaxID=1093978 RepID=A0AAV4IC81_9GAST|nr:hypothetical protein ElyMa_006583400 [Elysia marginata]
MEKEERQGNKTSQRLRAHGKWRRFYTSLCDAMELALNWFRGELTFGGLLGLSSLHRSHKCTGIVYLRQAPLAHCPGLCVRFGATTTDLGPQGHRLGTGPGVKRHWSTSGCTAATPRENLQSDGWSCVN